MIVRITTFSAPDSRGSGAVIMMLWGKSVVGEEYDMHSIANSNTDKSHRVDDDRVELKKRRFFVQIKGCVKVHKKRIFAR
jgi:hypothetical protein